MGTKTGKNVPKRMRFGAKGVRFLGKRIRKWAVFALKGVGF
jgi:hypothetical protein